MLTTSYNLAINADACEEMIEKGIEVFGPVEQFGADTPIPLATILEKLDYSAAVWALGCVTPGQEAERDRIARLFAGACAERLLPDFEREHPEDSRPRKAIEVARRFAVGRATKEELVVAYRDAWHSHTEALSDSAEDAAWAARTVARRDGHIFVSGIFTSEYEDDDDDRFRIFLDLLNGIEPASPSVATTPEPAETPAETSTDAR